LTHSVMICTNLLQRWQFQSWYILTYCNVDSFSHCILYTYSLGMRVVALLLSPMYQLLSEATPRTIVDTEGTKETLLPEYQVYKCFSILNNCAIEKNKL